MTTKPLVPRTHVLPGDIEVHGILLRPVPQHLDPSHMPGDDPARAGRAEDFLKPAKAALQEEEIADEVAWRKAAKAMQAPDLETAAQAMSDYHNVSLEVAKEIITANRAERERIAKLIARVDAAGELVRRNRQARARAAERAAPTPASTPARPRTLLEVIEANERLAAIFDKILWFEWRMPYRWPEWLVILPFFIGTIALMVLIGLAGAWIRS